MILLPLLPRYTVASYVLGGMSRVSDWKESYGELVMAVGRAVGLIRKGDYICAPGGVTASVDQLPAVR